MTIQKHQIVILGAGYAGLIAAFRLAGRTRGSSSEITLINAAPHFVERIRLHQRAAGQQTKVIALEKLLRGTAIRFIQGFATCINPVGQSMVIRSNSGEQTIPYDTLLYALGSTIDRDSVSGVREHAHVLTGDDMPRLREKLAKLPQGARVIVCGGGLTGIEAATEFAESYPKMRVMLITRDQVGESVSDGGREYLRATFKRLKIELREGTPIQRIEAHEIVTNDGVVPFDVCVWAGAFAVPSLARESGITTNERGQIIVDEMLRSISHPNIYAAGDSAFAAAHPVHIRMSCQAAVPMGAAAGDNIARDLSGKPQQSFNMGFVGQCVSLGRRDALVQIAKLDDTPRRRIVTGRFGALIKELVCLSTRYAIYAERNRIRLNVSPSPNWDKLLQSRGARVQRTV